MAAVMPLIAMGGFAVIMHRKGQPKVQDVSAEQQHIDQHMAIMQEYGISAPAHQAVFDKAVQMGGIINDGVGIDNSKGGYRADPNWDPIEAAMKEHAAVMSFDRTDTELALHTMRGEEVPRRRMPLAMSLTPELYNPKTGQHSEMYVSRFQTNHANAEQVRRAKLKMRRESPQEMSLRVHDTSEFWDHAPGQSFRYSED
jgi:hypothetical protein